MGTMTKTGNKSKNMDKNGEIYGRGTWMGNATKTSMGTRTSTRRSLEKRQRKVEIYKEGNGSW